MEGWCSRVRLVHLLFLYLLFFLLFSTALVWILHQTTSPWGLHMSSMDSSIVCNPFGGVHHLCFPLHVLMYLVFPLKPTLLYPQYYHFCIVLCLLHHLPASFCVFHISSFHMTPHIPSPISSPVPPDMFSFAFLLCYGISCL